MQLDYGESPILWQASQVFHPLSAFHPLQEYPLIIFGYTPFYHVVLNVLSRAVGNALLTGRLISMLSAFWMVGLLGWTVFYATRRYAGVTLRACAAVITCAVALQLPTMRWVPLARVDALGLALQFSALCLL